jgi:hypothetical protein
MVLCVIIDFSNEYSSAASLSPPPPAPHFVKQIEKFVK